MYCSLPATLDLAVTNLHRLNVALKKWAIAQHVAWRASRGKGVNFVGSLLDHYRILLVPHYFGRQRNAGKTRTLYHVT